jgi:GT2 family glycosyltransferase
MEKKLSVIIPNYNGRGLLAQNLPSVIKNCPKCQIIIVDDASTDDSTDFIRENFGQIKLIINKKNLGFARSVNIAVAKTDGDLILLLNSDVSPRPDFLKPAMDHFIKSDQKLFAVGLADRSHENGNIVLRGKGGAKFSKGFLNHFAAQVKPGETLWVSGGSGLFDRQKFLELGGFDSIYAPFYWEDIDLSYRARKIGLICLFEPKARVDHFHQQGAIKKNYSKFFIKTVVYRNQLLFVWKNISDYLLIIQHLFWLPYHFAKALITFDLAFFAGFLWALAKIPQLIGNWKFEIGNWKLTDKEVLSRLEKP